MSRGVLGRILAVVLVYAAGALVALAAIEAGAWIARMGR
jgi:hypothetical protein